MADLSIVVTNAATEAADGSSVLPPSLLAVVLVLGWIGTAIGWYLDNKKKRAEIVQLAGDTLEKLQTAREQYSQACSECSTSVNALISSLKARAGVRELDVAREQACSRLAERTLPRFQSYMEWEHLRYTYEPRERDRLVREQVLPELERYADWVSTLNHTPLLQHLSRNPLQITKATLAPFRDLCRGTTRDSKDELLRRVSEAANKIIQAGQRNT